MDYFFSVRGRSGDGYSNRMGSAKYISINEGATAVDRSMEIPRAQWFKAVQEAAGAVRDAAGTVVEKGHILMFVHGFNTDQWDMLERHRLIRDGLRAHGYTGAVVSFDWPSDGSVLGYNSDRRDARLSADKLFLDGIRRFSLMQTVDCDVNVHVLAHSMGCFVVREAFDFADDHHATAQNSWTVSQVALVAADISRKSFALGSPKTSSLLRHATRITNYYSLFDEALSISEVKRIGVSRRLGRVGMPDERSEKAVNLYCGDFYKNNKDTFGTGPSDSHAWYFESARFYEDLHHTLLGKLDREVIPNRGRTNRGNLAMI